MGIWKPFDFTITLKKLLFRSSVACYETNIVIFELNLLLFTDIFLSEFFLVGWRSLWGCRWKYSTKSFGSCSRSRVQPSSKAECNLRTSKVCPKWQSNNLKNEDILKIIWLSGYQFPSMAPVYTIFPAPFSTRRKISKIGTILFISPKT